MNTEEIHKENSSKLIEREQIIHTPFWIIGNEEQGYRGVMGKWGITAIFKRKEQVEEYISGSQWEIILTIAGIVAQDMIEAHEKETHKEISKETLHGKIEKYQKLREEFGDKG